MKIEIDTLQDNAVISLLQAHLKDMYATSPPESVHALDIEALKSADVTFWCAREESGEPLGCIALTQLNARQGEIKSMRTTECSRGKGVATAMLQHLIEEAEQRGYNTLSLETGSQEFFLPSRGLYEKFGFTYCEPFGDYTPDPNSCFMELKLTQEKTH